MQKVAEVVDRRKAGGNRMVLGRVIALKGFSTLPMDEIVAVDEDGSYVGDILGQPGRDAIGPAARNILATADQLASVQVSIHGPQIRELGLSCGGQAEVLLQPVDSIPSEVWALVAHRAPIALVTMIDGPAAGPAALALDRDGHRYGTLEVADDVLAEARTLLSGSRTMSRRVETEAGVALIEAWIPNPRLVVVGAGAMVDALEAQSALLGWEMRSTDQADVDELLDWAGATAALIVLSHDPHVDAPALAAALARPTPYIGAMGSRGTQSRRLTRLAADGIGDEDLARIHRPIGLNLGGRRACEVALSITAEILAVHCGRDGQSLSQTSGPIHG